jgi:hypothetical protein
VRTEVAKLAFNRGLVSRLGLARADIKRLQLAAETQTNFDSRVLGAMSLRPGWGYLGSSRNDAKAGASSPMSRSECSSPTHLSRGLR